MGSSAVPNAPPPPQISLLQPLACEEEEEEKLQEAKKKQVFPLDSVMPRWQWLLRGALGKGWEVLQQSGSWWSPVLGAEAGVKLLTLHNGHPEGKVPPGGKAGQPRRGRAGVPPAKEGTKWGVQPVPTDKCELLGCGQERQTSQVSIRSTVL